MKYSFLFLAIILIGCHVNGKNRIRFVHMKQDASANQLWMPDGGEKQEDTDEGNDATVFDAGLEPQTLEACQNSCYSMYGEDCNSHDTCDNMNHCMTDCSDKYNPSDAGTNECTNSCYARFGCHGDSQCQDLLVTCLLDCGEEIFPKDAQ